jgi:hypothetical protein
MPNYADALEYLSIALLASGPFIASTQNVGAGAKNVVLAAFPTPLVAVAPLGSLIYSGSTSGNLATPVDVHKFTIDLNPGQTLSLSATPAGPGQSLVTDVFDPQGNLLAESAAPAPGAKTLNQTIPVTVGGAYSVAVFDAGGALGSYTIHLYLNAAIEAEAANTTLLLAQDLNQSRFLLGPGNADRLAVLGDFVGAAPGTLEFYSFSLNQDQVATIVATSLDAGATAITLFDANGNVSASGLGGFAKVTQAIQNFVAPVAGTYYIDVTGDPGAHYSLVIVRGAGFDVGSNDTLFTAQSATGVNGVLGAFSTTQPGVDNHWYGVNVQRGNQLFLQSFTPSDHGGQFANRAAANLEVFDTYETFVAAGSFLADGRNQSLLFNAPVSGQIFVHAFNVPGNGGEFYLQVATPPYPSGGISGLVFNDLSATGVFNPADPGLDGRTLELFDSFGNFLSQHQSHGGGKFEFMGLDPGSYTVSELAPPGWTPTVPASPGSPSPATVAAGAVTSGLLFGEEGLDFPGGITVSRGGFRYNRATGRFVQLVMLQNAGGVAVTGPVSLVIDNLSANASVFNAIGTTSSVQPGGAPFVNATLGTAGVLDPGQSAVVSLEFIDPTLKGITYTTRVIAGVAAR